MKSSAKEAAMALISNGIAVYNCENFFKIYFTMIDRFKRNQVKVYGLLSRDPRLDSWKAKMVSAMRISDQLSADKTRVFNVMNHLKKS